MMNFILTTPILVGYGGNMKENEERDKEVQQTDEDEEVKEEKRVIAEASSHYRRFWDNPPPGADFFKPHTYLMVSRRHR